MLKRLLRLLVLMVVTIIAQHGNVSALVGTPHDFSALGGSPCSYCHSVHNSAGGMGLMNPGFGGFPLVTKVYSSATMNHKIDLNVVNRSDAPLCLACHDSANLASKSATNPDLAGIKSIIDTRPSAYINVDLSDDHPVGFTFDASLDPNLKAPDTAIVAWGPARDQMWCSTCHDVHDNQYGAFLVMSNANSALCLDCHRK